MARRARLAATAALGTVAAVMIGGGFLAALSGRLAVDFRLHYLPAARDVLHGDSPYSLADATLGHAYVYPPQVAFLLTPFTVLPDGVAALLALVVVASLLVGTLFILGVRDPLCYLALFLWAPTWQEFDMASVTPALAFALAVTWRYRNRTWPPAIALALAVPAKVFLWPLVVWTLATRRLPTTAYAIGVGTVLTFGLWAVLGYQGLADYPSMLQALGDANAAKGYSFVGIAASAGLPATVGHVAMLVVGVLLLAGCVVLGRRGDEQGGFFLALAAAFAFTPIVWMHYLVLLAVPLAIARPRFSLLWLLPIALWVGQRSVGFDETFQVLPLLVTAVIVARLVGDGHAIRLCAGVVERVLAARAGLPNTGRRLNAMLQLRDRTRLALVAVLTPAVTVMAIVTIVAAATGGIAGDFRTAFLPAAEAIMDGGSPYAVAGYVYPPQLAFVLTPLTVLPEDIAALTALVACAGLLIATLAVLGVRDPLCYLAMFAWTPTWNELDMVGVTPVLALGLALTWRYRDRTWPPAIALALTVSTKVFLWPMFVWTLATRRMRLAVFAAGVGLAITAALWFVLGFQGLVDYPGRLRDISASESIRRDSLSFVGLSTTLGLGVVVGHAMLLVTGVSLLIGSLVRGRRDDDRGAFCFALAAAVAMTPILWMHYLLLLLVPLAIARPRFTPLWLLPIVLWVGQEPMHPVGPLTLLPMLVIAVMIARVVSDGWHFRWRPSQWLDRDRRRLTCSRCPLAMRRYPKGTLLGDVWPARAIAQDLKPAGCTVKLGEAPVTRDSRPQPDQPRQC